MKRSKSTGKREYFLNSEKTEGELLIVNRHTNVDKSAWIGRLCICIYFILYVLLRKREWMGWRRIWGRRYTPTLISMKTQAFVIMWEITRCR